MRLKKKVVIPVVLLLIAGIGGVTAVRAVNAQPVLQTVETHPIVRGDLINSISVTGMVESGNTVNVYTTLSYPVQAVEVEVGDTVQQGDLLCQLDASALESTIRQNEATVSSAQSKANYNLELAQKDLDTVRGNVEKDYNSELLQAESSVENAEAAVERAENSLRSAQQTSSTARKDLREARDDEKELNNELYLSYDDLIESYLDASVKADIAVENAEIALEAAKKELEAAKSSRRATQAQVEQGESSTEDAIKTAQLNANFSDQYIALEKLRSDLVQATVTAPVSGTVTAVYAVEGASSSTGGGLLFIIEDTGDLRVKTKIKEYDIGMVDTGMDVTIKADGTGDEEFQGKLGKISPTTMKDETTGKTVDTTSAEFSAEVEVTSESSLRIGMNARMNIITEKRSNVLSIPTESIVVDEEGISSVFVLSAQEDGTFIAKKVAVTTGMETDFACEVIESELQEGDEVITNPIGLEDGMQVNKFDEEMMMQGAMMA